MRKTFGSRRKQGLPPRRRKQGREVSWRAYETGLDGQRNGRERRSPRRPSPDDSGQFEVVVDLRRIRGTANAANRRRDQRVLMKGAGCSISDRKRSPKWTCAEACPYASPEPERVATCLCACRFLIPRPKGRKTAAGRSPSPFGGPEVEICGWACGIKLPSPGGRRPPGK